jgi:DNA processing protein
VNNLKIIKLNDDLYPKKLKQIQNPPLQLYILGDYKILNQFSLAIIGCRNFSEYGKKMAKELSFKLSKRGINIISGMAKGIDSFAHISSIVAGGKTVAVLGGGFNNIYPRENIELMKEIIKTGGAVVTEYSPNIKPIGTNFPLRNRIISGLSDGVIVIEARKKSGTMITVDYALEQGKEIFALPGNINNPTSQGTNNMIREGAKIITSVEDILEEYRNLKESHLRK